MRHLARRALAAALFVGLCSASAARAEDPPAGVAGIRWVDGFVAGAESARASGKLLFVYVGRHHPT